MRSGDIDDKQTSCLVLAVALPAGAQVIYSLRTISDQVDTVWVFSDNRTLPSMLGGSAFPNHLGVVTRTWAESRATLRANTSNLAWCFIKGTAESGGEDAAWLDDLSFILPPPTKAQACSALDLSTADCALITGVSSTPPSGVTLPQGGCCRPVATDIP